MADSKLPPPESFHNLEWRTVQIAPDYEVSEHGQVRRVTDSRNGTLKAGDLLKLRIHRGYPTVDLTAQRGKKKTHQVHRLVARAYHGPPPTSLHEVAHLDGSRDNNYYQNLRWVTSRENTHQKQEHGTQTWGETHGRARLTNNQVREIRKLLGYATQRHIARKYKISRQVIGAIKAGKIWTRLA